MLDIKEKIKGLIRKREKEAPEEMDEGLPPADEEAAEDKEPESEEVDIPGNPEMTTEGERQVEKFKD